MTIFRVVSVVTVAALLSIATLYISSGSTGYVESIIREWADRQRIFVASHQSVFYPENADAENVSKLQNSEYLLGVGKADITGPVVELNLMGYADPDQTGTGLRQRLYSRAFIIGSGDSSAERFVYIVLDTQSGDTAVRYGILDALKELGPEYGLYSQKNVAVIGTHSHSGPGAWLNYLLPQITSKGFSRQSYQAIVDGASLSVQRAHASLRPGTLTFGLIDLVDANINRSPYAYLANLPEERSKYEYDVDKTLTMLKFDSLNDGETMGVLTWFPVHGTSMLGNNTLISGDNKGVAAWMLERDMKNYPNAAEGFVAGFSQTNVGDTSPNVLGAYCEDGSGEMCDFKNSTCGGKSQPCHGRGPGFRTKDQGATSCYEIGRRQFAAAKTLLDNMSKVGTPIQGPIVKSFHTFKDLSNYTFPHPNGSIVRTCPAALGYSFAAGTTDGPGAFDFTQNDPGKPNANPVWAVISGFLRAPSEEQKACHAPKPILLDVGEISEPYQWTPNIVDVQVLRVGQLILIISPGEATTMSGRRWKQAIYQSAQQHLDLGGVDPIVVLGAPANSYTHYIATEEEYSVQRYEGASTLYGPHTLNAHINLTTTYLPYLHSLSISSPPDGPFPPNYVNKSLSFIRGVVMDEPPLFHSFGDVLRDADAAYRPGSTVTVTFVGANPRNDLRLEDTYAAVEQWQPTAAASDPATAAELAIRGRPATTPATAKAAGSWVRVRDDADWSLVFHWRRTNTLLGTSEVDVIWIIENDVPPGGRYRLRYFGASKALIGGAITGFEAASGEFRIL